MEASGGHPQPWQTRYAHACAWDQTFPPLAMTDLFLAQAAAHPDAPLADFYGRIYSYAAMLAEAPTPFICRKRAAFHSLVAKLR